MNLAAHILATQHVWPNIRRYGILTGLAMAWMSASTEEKIIINKLAEAHQ